MAGPVRVAVLMTVEAGDAQARVLAPPIRRRVELLLGERREQETQPFELLGVQDPVEEAVVVVRRHQLPLGDVAQVRPRGQVDRRRELGQEAVGQVEVEVEAGQVPARLLLDLIDEEQGKDHAAFGMIRVGQGHEARRVQPLVADLVRGHLRQGLPGRSPRQLDADAVLDRLPPAHGHADGGTVAQIVARA